MTGLAWQGQALPLHVGMAGSAIPAAFPAIANPGNLAGTSPATTYYD